MIHQHISKEFIDLLQLTRKLCYPYISLKSSGNSDFNQLCSCYCLVTLPTSYYDNFLIEIQRII